MNEPHTPAPSAPQYRNLDAGDTAQPGDEYLECGQWRKIPSDAFRAADPFDFNSYAMRRPVPSAPQTQEGGSWMNEEQRASTERTPTKNQMTDDEMRVAIAGLDGWIKVRQHWEKKENGEVVGAYCDASMHAHRQLPNYLTDLNAMHSAEMAMTTRERGMMRANLYMMQPEGHCGDAVHADARQRALAFLAVKQPSGDGKEK